MYDVIVIGSGPAGTHAAYPLVMGGRQVAMLDGGQEPPPHMAAIPDSDYETIRREVGDQYRWFLGEDFSGIPLDPVAAAYGGTLGGNRAYMVRHTDERLPLKASRAMIIQSLARGGLGAAWGAVCAYFNGAELTKMGLPAQDMERHYAEITRRIGVSGPSQRPNVQPAATLDDHGALLLKTYERKRAYFARLGVRVNQPYCAVLTQAIGSRCATRYMDMDYWGDPRRSVYRPQYTLDELQRHPNFTYLGQRVVERVVEEGNGCRVEVTAIAPGPSTAKEHYLGRKVIVAAGAIGTARIALRSLNLYDRPLPLLAKPRSVIACCHWRMLGRAGTRHRISLCQLLVTDESASPMGEQGPRGYAQLYTYRSLQLLRLLNFAPAPVPEALGLLALLTPALVIADVRFPEEASPEKTLTLRRDAQGMDYVQIAIGEAATVWDAQAGSWRRLRRALRHLGLCPLRQQRLPHGAATHYGGTIPFDPAPIASPLSAEADGRLRGSRHIYIADSSTFRYLPAQSIAFTIMANANRVGEAVHQMLLHS